MNSCRTGGVRTLSISGDRPAVAPPIVLRRGAVVRVRLDTSGYALPSRHDPGNPRFSVGFLLEKGGFFGAEKVTVNAGYWDFVLIVPPESDGKVVIGSREYEIGDPSGAPPSLARRDELNHELSVRLGPGDTEKIVPLRIAARRQGSPR